MSNVDHAEIAKFEALAHRWWDRESEFKPLHDINPLRVNWIDERVTWPPRKSSTSVAAAVSSAKPWPSAAPR